jgi:hypothetical protein
MLSSSIPESNTGFHIFSVKIKVLRIFGAASTLRQSGLARRYDDDLPGIGPIHILKLFQERRQQISQSWISFGKKSWDLLWRGLFREDFGSQRL